jgi:hypothetical protein
MKFPEMIKRLPLFAAVLSTAAVGLVSCDDTIYDYEGDCDNYVKFTYTWNLKYADAFSSEVNSVALYVFDSDGLFVKSYETTADALADNDNMLKLDLDPGDYKFIAWCGLSGDNGSYTVPDLVAGTSSYTDLTNYVNRTASTDSTLASSGELDNLYYGTMDVTIPDDYTNHVFTLDLMKNTNVIKVALQILDGDDTTSTETYTMHVTAENGSMDWDNSLVSDETIVYKPYYSFTGTTEALLNEEEHTEIKVVEFELNTNRLVKGFGDEKPRITIQDSDGDTILSVPLIEYALLVKGKYNSSMSDQEYLDRQDNYDFIFFIQNGSWLATTIYINDWRIVLDEVEL